MREDIKKLMIAMVEKDASDLHIGACTPIHYRIDEELVPVDEKELSSEDAKDIIYSLIDKDRIARFEIEKELDLSIEIENVARYRINIFLQRGKIGCAIRLIPLKIRKLSDCGLPEDVVKKFCRQKKGLILVTGATGSGKSTTLAAMVDEINNNSTSHIVTIEDPIEFVHENKKSIIDQRQLLEDTRSFSEALTHVLRQDPDVILIGEMRDLETIQQAMIIADTGHLVLGTLHTSDTVQTINRIIDVFPAHQQKQIRVQLSFVMVGILAQQLIPCVNGKGRVLAFEVMVANPAIRSMIREGKEAQLYSILQTSQKIGMRTMNQSLAELYNAGKISREEAFLRSSDEEELTKLIGL